MPSVFFKTTSLAIVSMIYSVLIQIMFLIKKKKSDTRTAGKLYFGLTILVVLSMVLYILLGFLGTQNSVITIPLARFYLLVLLQWEFITIYYFSAAFVNDEEYIQKHNKNKIIINTTSGIITTTNILLSIFLPVSFSTVGQGNPYLLSGPLYNYFNIFGILVLLSAIYYFIKNFKKISKLTKVLFIITVLTVLLGYAIYYIFAMDINIEPFILTAFLFFLYLTIESQDEKLLLEYNESSKKAKESNELKSDFIMNMSHQLRTPMNTILGFSESLLTNDQINIEIVKEDTKNIKKAAKKLSTLINSILDISKIDSKKEKANMDNYQLDSIIYDISSNINSIIEKDNLLFTINANENCPNDLYGDGYKLCKILNIILANAIKHTSYGEVSLNISSLKLDEEYHEFTFHIKNTGHSMKSDIFEKNFEDLLKLNFENKNTIDSDTLNLIVAKEYIELIGGSITFINKTGEGTQYIIKLNQKILTQNLLGNINEKMQTRNNLALNLIDLTGKKALIIDDKKINTIILQRFLVQYNMEIENITNPIEAINRIKEQKYDLIFIEDKIMLTTGEELMSKIDLNTLGNKPIIGLLANSNQPKKDSKYTYYLESPIEFKQLNKLLNKIFGKKE